MGVFYGLLKRLFKLAFYFSIFFAIVVLLPNIEPSTQFTAIKLEPLLPLTGVLSLNNELGNVQKLYEGKLSGPEAFQVKDGEIYTSLATGEIVKVSPGGHVTFVTKLGQPCSGHLQENKCGRPLGIDIDLKKNLLYVADGYLGIWKVDLKSNKKQLLVSPNVEIAGRKPMLFNSVALDNKGQVYWTDSTSDFHLKDGVMSILTNPTGRLFQYNEAKNESTVLLDNLWFANGLGVSPDNQFIFVAESGANRIKKYYIAGPKKGQSEVMLAGIPGTPDNIRVLPDGSGFLLGLYNVYDESNPNLLHTLAETPLLRKFLVRLMRLVEIPFELLNNYYSHVIFEEIVYMVGNFKSLSGLLPKKSGLLQVDWKGNIVASYYNTDGTIIHISDAIVYNDLLYLGSPHYQDFIGAIPAPALLKKAFAKPKEILKDNSKPVHNTNAESKPTVEKKVVPPQNTLNANDKVETKPTKATVEKIEKPKSDTKKPEPVKATVIKQTPPKQPETLQKPAAKPIESKQAPVKETPTQQVSTPKPVETKQAPVKQTPPQVQTPKPVESKQAPVKQASTQQPPAKPVEKKQDPPSQVKEKKETPSGNKPKDNVQAPLKQPSKPEPVQTKPPQENKPIQKEKNVPEQPEQKKSSNVDTKSATKPVQKPSIKQETTPLPVQSPKTKDINQKPVESQKETSKPIPIKEDIQSDTVKPNKETLKVIKKDGPTEIPVPSP